MYVSESRQYMSTQPQFLIMLCIFFLASVGSDQIQSARIGEINMPTNEGLPH